MPVASLQPVTDPADERLADYVSLTDVALRSRQEPAKGLYIAESSTVLGRALAAGHRPRSVLLSPRWLPDLEVPYAVVLVEFADHPGVRIAGRVRGCAPEDVAIGMAVDVGFESGPGGVAVPSFVAVPRSVARPPER